MFISLNGVAYIGKEDLSLCDCKNQCSLLPDFITLKLNSYRSKECKSSSYRGSGVNRSYLGITNMHGILMII